MAAGWGRILCCYIRLQDKFQGAADSEVSLRRLLPTLTELHAITEKLLHPR